VADRFDAETKHEEVHVARVRAKLHVFGLGSLIATHPSGGYFLDADASLVIQNSPIVQNIPPAGGLCSQQYLDSYLRIGNVEDTESKATSGTGDTDAISTK